MKTIKIASRKSPLALWQANHVADRLRAAHSDLTVEIVGMVTQGDRLLSQRLSTQGGKGLFLKELEHSLLRQETDIAVHSMKDVPAELPEGLTLAAVCSREDPRDAFVSNQYQNIYALPKGARVGTASLRRTAQLKSAFPSLKFIELRGNVNTRLAKLDADEFDAIILASAGLIRLGLADRIRQHLPTELCLPAVGQGIMGIECRSDDVDSMAMLESMNDRESAICIAAERAMNAALGGGCHVPVAGFAQLEHQRLSMRGLVAAPDGSRVVVSQAAESLGGSILDERALTLQEEQQAAAQIGQNVANELIKQGGGALLESLFDGVTESQNPVVILTRQSQYLGNMATILSSLDYDPIHIPTIEIETRRGQRIDQLISRMRYFTDVVFVSRNAVDVGMDLINEAGGMPAQIRVMTVGPETAKQLHRYGIDASFPMGESGAEALLNTESLADLSGRNVMLLRGEFGLDWPAQVMRERGAVVEEVKCYAQLPPADSVGALAELKASGADVAAVFIHSVQSAKHLVQMAQSHYVDLLGVVAIVGSTRIADALVRLGWQGAVRVAESPANKHMMIGFSTRDRQTA